MKLWINLFLGNKSAKQNPLGNQVQLEENQHFQQDRESVKKDYWTKSTTDCLKYLGTTMCPVLC